jgi:hypothetical protein
VQSTEREECEDLEGRIVDSRKQRNPADRISAREPVSPGVRKEPAILFTHLMAGIGLALDRKHGRMFITDLLGNLTGIANAEIPGQPIP